MALTKEGGERTWLKRFDAWQKACHEKHDHRYLYSPERVEDNGVWKVRIQCPEHGEFLQAPAKHKFGQGCPTCKSVKPAETPLAYVRKQFPEATWPMQVVGGSKDKINGVCAYHGEFSTHLNRLKEKAKKGHVACPRCSRSKGSRRILPSEWSVRIAEATGCEVDETSVTTSDQPAKVTCPEHGEWWARPQDLVRGHGCPECWKGAKRSKGEQEVCDWLESLGVTVLENLDLPEVGKGASEYDIAVQTPEGLLLIDYHGVWFHGDRVQKNRNWHLEKLNRVNVPGIRYVQIFEDEWAFKRDVVKSRLLHLLGKSADKTYARKLRVAVIEWAQASEFFEQQHLQGAGTKTGQNWALLDGDRVVACMSFAAPRFDKTVDVELLRYATVGSVVGGFSRLLKAFLKARPGVMSVGTYADKRWSLGDVYEKHGFTHDGDTQPGYAWYKNLNRVSRHKAQKAQLAQWLPNFDPALTEVQNLQMNGYWRVYDAGHSRWVLKRNTLTTG